MKALLLSFLLLTGCATPPIIHNQTFPTPPADLMEPAKKLQPIAGANDGTGDPKLVLSSVVDNNMIALQNAAQLEKIQLWIIWTKANIDSQGKNQPK